MPAWKTYFQCVVTHPIGNLRGTTTSRIVSQNTNSLTLQGFLDGQTRRKANVSSFGESMTCSESVSCLFRPRNWSRKSNKMSLLSLENTHYPKSFASLAFWGKTSSFFFLSDRECSKPCVVIWEGNSSNTANPIFCFL